MALSQQNHLRLQVMMSIHHPDEYYQQALKSKGIDYTNLTHGQIAVFIATVKAIEADAMIEVAENLPIEVIKPEDIEAVCPEVTE